MVKVGDFTVELVRADTKEAFKEHIGPSGVYAEVEPDVEYFVCLGTSIGGVRADITVDGVYLNYYVSFTSPRARSYKGGYERKDGKSITMALRFNKTRERRDGEVLPNTMLTGKVEVAFRRLGAAYEATKEDFASSELNGETKTGGKKCVMSKKGEYVQKVKPASTTRYAKGDHVCTVTLHYCTALGLIYNGLLAPPPPESTSKGTPLKKKRSRASAKGAPAAVSPEEKKTKYNEPSMEVVSVPKTYELVDLTGDDDEEGMI